MAQVSTGYEGPDGTEDEGIVTFDLEVVMYLYTAQGTACRLIRNGIAVGVFYLRSDDEYKWMRDRIAGAFDPEIYQVKIKGEEVP